MNVGSILKGVAGWFGVGRKAISRAAVRRARPAVEGLEERAVPSLSDILGHVPWATAPAVGSSIPNLGPNTQPEGNGSFYSGYGTPLGGSPYGPLAPYYGQPFGGAPVKNPLALFSGTGAQVGASQVQLGHAAASGATTGTLANATYASIQQGHYTTNQLYTNLPGVPQFLSSLDSGLLSSFGGLGVKPPAPQPNSGGLLGQIYSGTLGMPSNTHYGASLTQLGSLFPMGLPGVPGQVLGTGVNYGLSGWL
jgi:hypothetical protein